MKWNLIDGLALCRLLETRAKGRFHFALAGSVLYKGESSKDLDVIVYPHTNCFLHEDQHELSTLLTELEILPALSSKGHTEFTKSTQPGFRTVWKLTYDNRPVDLFLFS